MDGIHPLERLERIAVALEIIANHLLNPPVYKNFTERLDDAKGKSVYPK